MKIIKVTSCNECPHLGFDMNGREEYYCGKTYITLAREGQIVIEEAIINSITMTVIPEHKAWTYLLPDEITEWNRYTFPEWCPLEDAV
jgi:hypothetical protein